MTPTASRAAATADPARADDSAATPVGEGDSPEASAGDAGASAPTSSDSRDDDAAPASDGNAPAPSRDYDTWRGKATNGHDDSILHPVERRP